MPGGRQRRQSWERLAHRRPVTSAPVLRYLSEEWIEACAAAARSAGDAGAVGEADGILVIENEVTDASAPGVRYHLVVGQGPATFVAGPAPHADIRFVTDRVTAAEVARGDLSVQSALLSGRLTAAGDLRRLSTVTAALTAVGAELSEVLARTDWG